MDRSYLRQAELVVRCIPAIAAEPSFAIKGGTARGIDVRMRGTDVSRKLGCFANGAEIKIEPNFILRGNVYPVRRLELSPKMADIVGVSAEIQVLSFRELYGGKVCAALDRQRLLDFVSLSNGSGAFGIPNFDDLPAIRWKRHNLESLRKSNPAKFALQRDALAQLLEKGMEK